MQAIVETLFDAAYLITVITIGIIMIAKSGKNSQYRLFGIMAIVLGSGDAFHLVPRAYALCTTGLENFTAALGTGKFITSITMTVFYVILYYVWRIRYNVKGQNGITAAVYILSALRIILCLFPQNEWLSAEAPISWGIYRNIPFALLGFITYHGMTAEQFIWAWLRSEMLEPKELKFEDSNYYYAALKGTIEELQNGGSGRKRKKQPKHLSKRKEEKHD